MEHVDPRYIVPIYLDTNILVDYIDGTYPLLNKSISILQACPFVQLRSSHYVRFEFVEIRKILLFSQKVNGRNPSQREKERIKQTWELAGHKYVDYAHEIELQVIRELKIISEDLKITFDDHVLHEQLILPTSELILRTSLSREDSLVLTSSVYPNVDVFLDFVVLLTMDKQFCNASSSLPHNIIGLFASHRTNMPHIMNARCVQCANKGAMLNMTLDFKDEDVVQEVWNNIISNLIVEKNKAQFAGITYKYGGKGNASKCVYFKLKADTGVLESSTSLCIIPSTLDTQIILKVDAHNFYWNNGTIIENLPAEIKDNRLSFLPQDIDSIKLEKVRKKDCIVFYYDD